MSTGLVLEGGAFRGLFTAGVLDGLLDIKAELKYVIGVSAGISNAYSYVSKQRGRNLEIMEKYMGDKFTDKVYQRDPEESYKLILEHLKKILPQASEEQIKKILK